MAGSREVKASWKGGMTFECVGRKDFRVVMDTATELGGREQSFTPTEIVLVGLAGCTAMDVISILRKKRQDVTKLEVTARGIAADDHPRVYTDIEIEFLVRGRGVDPKAVARSIELSETKYCPVTAMLNKTAKISTTYRIEEA